MGNRVQSKVDGKLTFDKAVCIVQREGFGVYETKIAHNTRLRIDRDNTEKQGFVSVSLLLHGNKIASWFPNGNIQIWSGGYKSVTTKARLNQFVGACVYQTGGKWYITNNTPFEEGMILKFA